MSGTRELIAKWRDDKPYRDGEYWAGVRACADELEATLDGDRPGQSGVSIAEQNKLNIIRMELTERDDGLTIEAEKWMLALIDRLLSQPTGWEQAKEACAQAVRKWNFMACSDADGLVEEIRSLPPPAAAWEKRVERKQKG